MINTERRVVCAAVRSYSDQLIICSARHFDNITRETIMALDEERGAGEWEQGFINTWGEFLTREEAWIVACANNQILKYVGSQTPDDFGKEGVKLYSENLY